MDERTKYSWANPGFSMATGHFTQVVWKATTDVGCGWARCVFGTFLVCNYKGPGNYEGRFPENVLPRK